MLRAALRGLWMHKLRTILLALAVVLGVAFVTASFVFTDTLANGFDNLFADALAGTDITITATIDEDDFTFLPDRIDPAVIDDVLTVDQVTGAYPTVAGFPQLEILDADGNPQIVTTGAPILGFSWSEGPSPISVREGRAPTGPGEIVIDVGTAERLDFGVGKEIRMSTTGALEPYTVVGLIGFGASDNLLGAAIVSVAFEVADEIFGADGKVDSIDLTIADGAELNPTLDAVQAVLPEGVEARSTQSVAEEQAGDTQEVLGFINTFFLVFGFIAVFVGVFVVYNAFRTVIGQRTRELGLFRLIGAERRQVLGSVMLEAVMIGLVASVLGLILGVLLAIGARALFQSIGIVQLGDNPTQLLPRTLLWTFGVGLTATTVSALIPAIRASGIPPMAAIRDVEKPTKNLGLRIAFATIVFVASVAVVVTGVLQMWSLTVIGIASGGVVIGTYLLAAVLARPVLGVLGRPFEGRMTGRLAAQNARRSPRRTAATAGALMLALALVVATAVMVFSIQDTARTAIEDGFGADLIVQGGFTGGFTGISPDIAPRLRELPEVAVAAPVNGTQAQVEDDVTFITGIDPFFEEVAVFEGIEGDFGALVGNTVAIQKIEADETGLVIGDTVEITITGDPIEYEVVTIFDFGSEASDNVDYYLPYSTIRELVPESGDFQVSVVLAEGVEVEAGKAAIETVLEDFTGAMVLSLADVLQQLETQLFAFLGLIFGLLAISVFVALFGVTLTLVLAVFERTREIGLLRAIGMNKPQVRNMVRIEAVVVSVFGALLGIGIGILLGWALSVAVIGEGTRFVVPWVWVAVGLVVAAVAGLGSAVWPSYRASNLDVLEAIAYE